MPRPPTRPPADPRPADPLAFVEAARRRLAAAPSAEAEADLRRLIAQAGGHYADRDRYPEFNRVLAAAVGVAADDPGWAAERAGLLARGGQLAQALAVADALPDPAAARAAALAHAADRAVRLRSRDAVPADLHPGFDAVLLAFREYHAGRDEAARAALEAVGLRSPFLDWKLLVRGLLAYSAGDDGRAVENWQRLSPDRLPARLAAPLRAAVDPPFKAAQPSDVAAALAAQAAALTPSGLADALTQIRGELGRDKPLTAAFRQAERLLPRLKKDHPPLADRLARCFYRAILTQGEPADLPRFRRLFGPPPDDPDFHRLEALIMEETGDLATANRKWAAYEAWLGGHKHPWPADLARRARAVVLHRMGRNAARLAADPDDDGDDGDLRDLFQTLFGGPKRRAGKKKPAADPLPLFRTAAELAPDWADPVRELFDRHAAAGRADEAEAVARAFLDRQPGAVDLLAALAGLYQRLGRPADALTARQKALAANPLDKKARALAAYAFLAAARRSLADGDPAAADATLAAGRELCEENTPAGYFALRSVVARKGGRPADADALRDRAVAVPGRRLAAALFLSVDSGLAKLKPADTRAANKRLADALADPAPTPLEVNLLYAAWDQYHIEGITYRGQKTQEKKVWALLPAAAEADAPEADFEALGQGLAVRNEWAVCRKFADRLEERFPANPLFPLLLAEAEFAKYDGDPPPYRVVGLLNRAKAAAERSPEPRHRALLEKIAELQRAAAPGGMFEMFFDR